MVCYGVIACFALDTDSWYMLFLISLLFPFELWFVLRLFISLRVIGCPFAYCLRCLGCLGMGGCFVVLIMCFLGRAVDFARVLL